jgi:uncharacterized protein YjdB
MLKSTKKYNIVLKLFNVFMLLIFILTTLAPLKISYAAEVKINQSQAALIKGDTLILEITGTTKTVTWKSDKPKIANVNDNGKVKAINTGKAIITATANNKKYKCSVTVETPKINTTEVTTRIGWTEQLKLDGTRQDIIWSSSNDAIATVSDDGLVTGCDIGEAIITATIGKHKYKCTVKIPQPYLWETSLDIGVGDTVMNHISYASDDTTYESNDETIAKVDKYGNVTGIKDGITLVTITSGGYTYSFNVTVKKTSYLNAEKMAAYGLIMLNELLKDPSSLTINNIYHTKTDENSDKQEVVVIDYTATNSLGGRVRSYMSIMTADEIYSTGYTLESDDLGYIFIYVSDSKPSNITSESLSIDSVLKVKANKQQKSYTIHY